MDKRIRKNKKKRIKKILYVSIEEGNKRLEQAFKIVYNANIQETINKKVEKIAKYTQKKWASFGEQEIIKAYLSENQKEYEEIKDIEDLIEKKKEKFTTFERMRPYSKGKWSEILNELYKEHFEEMKEYI